MAIALPIRDTPRDEPIHHAKMIGKSKAISDVQRLIERVAPSDANILIYGETGTGKELVAHEIHRLSRRARQPFVVIDCTSLPSELVETELFGHERGAFTGATDRRDGKFGQANGGTVFLDEIGDLPLQSQAKLLGVLQRREFSRVGGNGTIKVDVRIIAATNRALDEMVQAGQFRDDLYYRLNVIPITIPPLRDRKEDLWALVDYFLHKYQFGCRKTITPPALALLMRHDWRGNIRELEHTIERLCILSNKPTIDYDDVTLDSAVNFARYAKEPQRKYVNIAKEVERETIIAALEQHGWNQTRTAQALGMHRPSLALKIKRYGIEYEQTSSRRKRTKAEIEGL